MDYPTLLLYIENQLQWLQKQNCHYLNIDALPQIELQKLVTGIKSIQNPQFSHKVVDDIPVQSKNNTGEQLHRIKQALASETRQHPQKTLHFTPFSTDLPQQRGALFPPSLDSLSQQEITTKDAPAFSTDTVSVESSLRHLEQKNCNCQRCPLGKTRKNLVFGTGNAESLVMFIGEGPGADEDRLGEPFVGKAGRLLNKMVEVLGLNRMDFYIANVVKCRPTGNRNPTVAEVSQCLPILEQQIELVHPRLIVTLGNVPTQALLPGIDGITKVRGHLQKYRQWTVLPTFHPSYLLRNRSAMHFAWDDFRQIPVLVNLFR